MADVSAQLERLDIEVKSWEERTKLAADRVRLADIEHHSELLAVARDDVKLIIERDPSLETARGEALRILLYLFERDAAVRLARAG